MPLVCTRRPSAGLADDLVGDRPLHHLAHGSEHRHRVVFADNDFERAAGHDDASRRRRSSVPGGPRPRRRRSCCCPRRACSRRRAPRSRSGCGAVEHPHELHVGARGEERVVLEQRAEAPRQLGGDLVDVDDAVRVAHRHRGERRRSPPTSISSPTTSRRGPRTGISALSKLAVPISTKTDAPGVADLAADGPAPGHDQERLLADAALVPEVAREDAQAVAALLRLAAVRVEDAEGEVCPASGESSSMQDAVGADAEVPVADAPDEGGRQARDDRVGARSGRHRSGQRPGRSSRSRTM